MDVRPVLIDQINIGERQREDVGDLADLSANIRQFGLLHPIVITRDSYMLMAGYRRLMACKAAGWTSIPCHFFEELTPRQQFQIEFIENEKRQALSWEERAKAIQKYHYMCLNEEGLDWNQENTGKDLDLKQNSISRYLTVAKELQDPEVSKATSIGTAVNTVNRLKKRRDADRVYTISTMDKVYTDHPIQQADFNTWAPLYSGQPFNFIHCDFPYGINAHRSEGQNSALDVDYNDSPDVLDKLLYTLRYHLDRFCAPSAHMIFWFSPAMYQDIWEALTWLQGFKFDEHPLIWMRGENEGIAPDPNRRPRRCYEMAFFGWRGDRPIIKTKANIFQAPTTRKDHPHEKSELALRHFFEMCVDNNTRLLDPTSGSGSALRAARAITGDCTVSGLEANPEYVASARRLFDGPTVSSGGGLREDLLDSMVRGHEAGQGNGAASSDLSG